MATDRAPQRPLVWLRFAKNLKLIEAPNWTPDGRALVDDGKGNLFLVPIDESKMIQIESGFVNRINNDHGISPDGARIVFSDSSEKAYPFESATTRY